MEEFLIYTGKVRKIYKVGDNHLLMSATDRVSSFDRHIGTIPGKGELLNKMSEFLFNKTKHIIDIMGRLEVFVSYLNKLPKNI